jgi:hypothetical protein
MKNNFRQKACKPKTNGNATIWRRALEHSPDRRTIEVKARLNKTEADAFLDWRRNRGLTTSQALRVMINVNARNKTPHG